MRQLPPLNAVRVFESAARHLSFNGASNELNVTPSAVSHQIRLLEEYLGVRLFFRATRRVELTAKGTAFQSVVGAALVQIESATRQVRQIREDDSSALTLSVLPSFAAEWLVVRLAAFQAAHPGVEVRIITDHRVPDFKRTDVDMAIVAGSGDWTGLTSHKLIDEDLVPVCSPTLMQGPSAIASLKDLCAATLIHVSYQPERWPNWLKAVSVDHPSPMQGPKLPTTALALEAAESGSGVALANRLYLDSHFASGRLAVLFDLDLRTGREIYLVYPDENASREIIKVFKDWLLALISTNV